MFAIVEDDVDVRLCGFVLIENSLLIRLPLLSSSAPAVACVKGSEAGVLVVGLDTEDLWCDGTICENTDVGVCV